MLATMRHRGPDSDGVYGDSDVALGAVRLAIIDLEGGQQPIRNEDGTIWIVFNGEIYNFEALRCQLGRLGHRFGHARYRGRAPCVRGVRQRVRTAPERHL